jgi:hypothetical protein
MVFPVLDQPDGSATALIIRVLGISPFTSCRGLIAQGCDTARSMGDRFAHATFAEPDDRNGDVSIKPAAGARLCLCRGSMRQALRRADARSRPNASLRLPRFA